MAKTATYTHAYAESNGFLTLLSDGERLTGAYALGPEAGEWLQQATLAIRARVPLDVLLDTIQPFPTFSEIYVDALKALRAEIGGLDERARQLDGQTVVVIGGSAGHRARDRPAAPAPQGADVILTARNPERLERRGARGRARSAPRRSTPPTAIALERFFGELPAQIDHVLVTRRRPVLRAAGRVRLRGGAARVDEHLWLAAPPRPLAAGKVRPGGSLLFISGTGGRRRGHRA